VERALAAATAEAADSLQRATLLRDHAKAASAERASQQKKARPVAACTRNTRLHARADAPRIAHAARSSAVSSCCRGLGSLAGPLWRSQAGSRTR
jgi:hypothetical protein